MRDIFMSIDVERILKTSLKENLRHDMEQNKVLLLLCPLGLLHSVESSTRRWSEKGAWSGLVMCEPGLGYFLEIGCS